MHKDLSVIILSNSKPETFIEVPSFALLMNEAQQMRLAAMRSSSLFDEYLDADRSVLDPYKTDLSYFAKMFYGFSPYEFAKNFVWRLSLTFDKHNAQLLEGVTIFVNGTPITLSGGPRDRIRTAYAYLYPTPEGKNMFHVYVDNAHVEQIICSVKIELACKYSPIENFQRANLIYGNEGKVFLPKENKSDIGFSIKDDELTIKIDKNALTLSLNEYVDETTFGKVEKLRKSTSGKANSEIVKAYTSFIEENYVSVSEDGTKTLERDKIIHDLSLCGETLTKRINTFIHSSFPYINNEIPLYVSNKVSDYTNRKNATFINKNRSSSLLLRTNPKLTGNIKLVYDTKNRLFLDTFKVSEELNNKKYRHRLVSSEAVYSNDVRNVFSDLPPSVLFGVNKKNFKTDNVYLNPNDQIDDTYSYGA